MKTPYPLTNEQSTLTDLVRRLEKDNYDFGVDIASIENELKKENAEPIEKFYLRADALDDGTLSHALRQAKNKIKFANVMLGGVYLVIGLIISVAILASGFVSIFYLLPIVIIANLILIARSFTAYRYTDNELLPFNKLIKRPQADDLDSHALATTLGEHNTNRYWQAITLIQSNWLGAWVGVMIGAMVAYMIKPESFIWQAASYHGHKATIANIINIIPQVFGSQFDNITTSPNQLVYFIVISIFIYAIVPRAIAWGLCQFKIKQTPYQIDLSLYYYDELYRKFSHKISDERDYVAYNTKPEQAHFDSAIQTVVASVARPAIDETWYRFGAGFKVYDFGVVTGETLEQFIATIEIKKKPVCLAVFNDDFPDDDKQELILTIKRFADYGLSVEIIKAVDDYRHNYFDKDWEEFLLNHHISQVRYS